MAAFVCAGIADAQNLLYVRGDTNYSTQDNLRITQFQSWGYTVTSIVDSDSQATYDSALASTDVVYVIEEVSASSVSYKLRETTLGVVCEEAFQADELGVATGTPGAVSTDTLTITDNSHYITSPFSTGSLTISSPAADLRTIETTFATDLQPLGDFGSSVGLAVLEAGDELANTYNSSNTAFGRRVLIPCNSNFDWADLTSDGLTIIQRALEWAAGNENGLVGHWKLDETSGTTAADSSGNDRDGVYNADLTLGVAGVRQTAVGLDGVDDQVRVANSSLPTLAGSLSVGCWAKSDTATWNASGCLVNRRDQFILGPVAGGTTVEFSVKINGSWQAVQADAGVVDQWRQYVGVYDNADGEIRLYVDNALLATQSVTASATLDSNTQALFIGRDVTNYFTGTIDDVVLYDGAISDAEIAEHYGLVGHWKLDETSGTVATDSSGMGNDGTYESNVTLGETGIRSTAARFSLAADEGVEIPYHASLRSTEAASVAAWVYADSVGNWRQIYSDRSPGENDGFRIRVNNNQKLQLNYVGPTGADALNSPNDFPTGRWVQVVGVYTGAETRLYIDGEVVASGAASGSITNETGPSYIGRYVDGYPWDGQIDDVMLYNRAMTDQEIAEHYGLVGHWKLNETSGTVANDSTPFENHGELLGAATWTTSGGQQAVDLDGSSSYIDLGNPSHLNFEGPITMSAWVRVRSYPTGKSENILAHGHQRGPNKEVILRLNPAGEYDTGTWVPNVHAQTTIPSGDQNFWVHLTSVNDGVNWYLYRNGQLEDSVSGSTGATKVDNKNWAIGARGGGGERFLDGKVRDVRIYNRAITPAEVAEMYGLVGWWRMEEVSGTLASDSSGAGNHGAVVGTSAWSTDSKEGFGSIEFDGSNYVEIPSLILTDAPSGATVSGWAKLTDVESRGADLVSIGDYLFVRLDQVPGNKGTTAYMYHGSGWNGAAPGNFYEGSGWHHFSAVYDATALEIHLYIDGVLSATEPASGPLAFSGRGSTIKIGKQGHTSNLWDFTGLVDDIRVYNRSITREEARFLYSGDYTPGPRIIRWVEVR